MATHSDDERETNPAWRPGGDIQAMDGTDIVSPFDQLKRLRVLQIGAILAALTLLASRPAWNEESITHELIESVGFVLILACVFGRLWSILYLGGRKNKELVTVGPYSTSRNPLYFFSTVGACGVGLMFGSVVLAALLAIFVYAILTYTAGREAAFLSSRFGAEYDGYADRTPLFWPNPSLYVESAMPTFSPRILRRTFADGLYFLALFPAIELVEYFQESGAIPTLLKLY